MLTFERGSKYTRPDVKERAGLLRDAKGGNWDTGVVQHENEFLISTSGPRAARGTTMGTAGREAAFAGTTKPGLISGGKASRSCWSRDEESTYSGAARTKRPSSTRVRLLPPRSPTRRPSRSSGRSKLPKASLNLPSRAPSRSLAVSIAKVRSDRFW